MKLVIDIPDNVYEWVKNTGKFGMYRFDTAKVIKNGIPFDDIKKKVWLTDFDFGDYSDHTEEIQDKVIGILDNIGKKARG